MNQYEILDESLSYLNEGIIDKFKSILKKKKHRKRSRNPENSNKSSFIEYEYRENKEKKALLEKILKEAKASLPAMNKGCENAFDVCTIEDNEDFYTESRIVGEPDDKWKSYADWIMLLSYSWHDIKNKDKYEGLSKTEYSETKEVQVMYNNMNNAEKILHNLSKYGDIEVDGEYDEGGIDLYIN